MTNSLKVSKKDILQKRTFTPKLTVDDTIAFALLAAERGLTPNKLIESFVRDFVSSFSVPVYEITENEKHLLDWFNSSWFSQDNDGYFTFLQYMLINKLYNCLDEIEDVLSDVEHHKKLKSKQWENISDYFEDYCKRTPAHKSFDEELEIIKNFYNYTHEISKGGKCKWHW